MNEFVPRGYLAFKKALEYFGRRRETAKLSDIGREALDHELENTEKASSKQEFQQLLFEETVSAKHFIGGKLLSLESSIWGRAEAEYIFASGWATIHGGDEYFPSEVRGPVLIEQSSIDALFDRDSDDPSQSPEAISDGAPLPEPPPSTTGAETKCRKWLTALMTGNSKPEKAKAAYKTEAQAEFSVGAKAFDRAWARAIEKTGNAAWSRPGRKS